MSDPIPFLCCAMNFFVCGWFARAALESWYRLKKSQEKFDKETLP